jgi:hypothetical protein
MEIVAIITLRESINTGNGVTQMLEVTDYKLPYTDDLLRFSIPGGGEGVVSMRNVAGIYPKIKKQETEL